jgi:hypothetical protein
MLAGASVSGAPQRLQNLAPIRFSVWQAGQVWGMNAAAVAMTAGGFGGKGAQGPRPKRCPC